MGVDCWFGRRGCARAAVAAALFAAGCSRESAPEAPKAPAAPEPAPQESAPAAPEPSPPPPPAAAPAAEGASAVPQAAPLRQPPRQVEPRPTGAAKPEAPATKARRSRSADDERADQEIGSGGAAGPGPAALHAELEREERAAAPDCSAARERTKAICDLAGQICRLTDRDPNVASVAEYCDDARQRCGAAERRTAERCPD